MDPILKVDTNEIDELKAQVDKLKAELLEKDAVIEKLKAQVEELTLPKKQPKVEVDSLKLDDIPKAAVLNNSATKGRVTPRKKSVAVVREEVKAPDEVAEVEQKEEVKEEEVAENFKKKMATMGGVSMMPQAALLSKLKKGNSSEEIDSALKKNALSRSKEAINVSVENELTKKLAQRSKDLLSENNVVKEEPAKVVVGGASGRGSFAKQASLPSQPVDVKLSPFGSTLKKSNKNIVDIKPESKPLDAKRDVVQPIQDPVKADGKKEPTKPELPKEPFKLQGSFKGKIDSKTEAKDKADVKSDQSPNSTESKSPSKLQPGKFGAGYTRPRSDSNSKSQPLNEPQVTKSAGATQPTVSNPTASSSDDEKELRLWIGEILKEPLQDVPLKQSLKDGQILCKLVNKARKDGQQIKINMGKFSASHLENINSYLKALKDVYKIPQSQLFAVNDLYEGNNIDAVCKNLQLLKKAIK